ncbi:MAG TPA: SH3 domain-containing protein [Lacipirellulaceae bacterium]|nr:SH3 domain-containing protein [Lacipirellulaceae bacterium]
MRQPLLIEEHSIYIALICALLAFAHAEPVAADSLPYQARVVTAGAPVLSGPGQKFYPTDSLAQGDTVDVYREKPGGWLAIRPPVNSFSWIAERDLILKDGGLAEIVKDGVASRIGSRINNRHNAVQVRLKKGEAVEVVGEDTINGEKWYKIAPPAGEFRWIQASLVEKIGPIPNDRTNVPPNAETAVSVGRQAESNTANPGPSAVTRIENPDNGQPTAVPQPPAPSHQSPAPNPESADLSHDLTAIELRLSRMAAAPPSLWNTERLERDAAQLMARAKTPAERDAVRVTQDKINQFAAIGRQYNQTPSLVAQAGQPPITPLPGTVATAANGRPYDAVGILRPVVSRRPGAPQFALVDDRGQVVSFVTPTPDLNLQPYLGHRIGIVGNRGYIPEFQRATVTAARVTPLNDRIIR